MLNHDFMISDPGLNRREATLVRLVAKEEDIGTRLALILAFELDVRLLVWWENDMASGDKEKLVAVVAFGWCLQHKVWSGQRWGDRARE